MNFSKPSLSLRDNTKECYVFFLVLVTWEYERNPVTLDLVPSTRYISVGLQDVYHPYLFWVCLRWLWWFTFKKILVEVCYRFSKWILQNLCSRSWVFSCYRRNISCWPFQVGNLVPLNQPFIPNCLTSNGLNG